MRRDVTYFDGGRGRRHGLSSLSHSRWPMLWLAVALGGALLLALLVAQAVRAESHMATLESLVLSDVELKPAFDANMTMYTATVAHGVAQTTVAATAMDASARSLLLRRLIKRGRLAIR